MSVEELIAELQKMSPKATVFTKEEKGFIFADTVTSIGDEDSQVVIIHFGELGRR